MDLSHLNSVSEASKDLSDETRNFIEGLFVLADHWNGEHGINEIKSRMWDLISKGVPTQEAAVECYHYVRSKVV